MLSYQTACWRFWKTAKTGAAHLCQGRPIAQGGINGIYTHPCSLWNHTHTYTPSCLKAKKKKITQLSTLARDTPQWGLHAEKHHRFFPLRHSGGSCLNISVLTHEPWTKVTHFRCEQQPKVRKTSKLSSKSAHLTCTSAVVELQLEIKRKRIKMTFFFLPLRVMKATELTAFQIWLNKLDFLNQMKGFICWTVQSKATGICASVVLVTGTLRSRKSAARHVFSNFMVFRAQKKELVHGWK